MIIYTHNDCLKKFNGHGHPERKERLEIIISSIKSSFELNAIFKQAPIAEMNNISLVHPRKYIQELLKNIPLEGLKGVEKEPNADTMLCPYSKNAILRSCGAGKIMKEYFVL